MNGVLTAAIPIALISGLLGLIRSLALRVHAVAGALAICLLFRLVDDALGEPVVVCVATGLTQASMPIGDRLDVVD